MASASRYEWRRRCCERRASVCEDSDCEACEAALRCALRCVDVAVGCGASVCRRAPSWLSATSASAQHHTKKIKY
eukprot:scaffold16066_cov173-Isochrysis_galbana.AAC.2